jgi:hypothetical protein
MASPIPNRRQHRARALKIAVIALFAGIASTTLAAPATVELDPWKQTGSEYYIGGIPRLNLGFTDQTGTPTVAIVSSLKPEQLAGMPDGLVQAKNSDIFQPGHFEALWNAMKAQVCADVQNQITTLVNHSPNTAYDVQPCALGERGYLWASFQENWTNDSMQNVSGRRIRFNYRVPYNGAIFWVTSPHTCHHGDTCPTEPQDPVFSYVFSVVLTVTCTSMTPNATTFQLPATCVPAGTIEMDGLFGGDVTGQLVAAAKQFAAQLAAEAAVAAASGGTVAPAAVVAAIEGAINVTVKGIGAAVAAISDQHLSDSVSAWLGGYVRSQTLDNNAVSASSDFTTLFQNLYYATLGGLQPFVVRVEYPSWDLDFGLIYPLPAKPVLQNTTASTNKGSLFSPMIAVSQPQVIAGQTIPVTCTDFRGVYVNTLNIAWNKTVLGTPKSALGWGPPDQIVTIPAVAFDATNLKPSTVYQFVVKECDGLTCAPKSDVLKTETEAASANEVSFWLDNNTSQIIGTSAIPANPYNFMANVTIPASTTTGTHLLHAVEVGSQPATATINVCAVGGCGAFIGVLNTQNNTFYPPGSLVGVGNTIVVRGSKFAPGGSAWIWVDGVKGTKAAEAPVGPLGNFQASFRMPLIQAGNHTFVAIELKPGSKIPPTPKGKIPVIPPQDFVTANVAIFVEAAVQ